MILTLAHMGHWLIGLGFASAPLTVIGGIVAIAIAERRRGERCRDHRSDEARFTGPAQPRWRARRRAAARSSGGRLG